MADKIARRGISLYIDGNKVLNSVKGIKDEMTKLTNEQKKFTLGGEDYTRLGMKIGRLDAILQDHKQNQANITKEYRQMTNAAIDYDKKKNSAFSFSSLSSGVENFFNKVKYGAAAVVAAIMGVEKLTSKYAELDEAKSGVRKYTSLTPEEVNLLNEELKKFDTKTTRIALNDLESEAGKLGIKGVQNLLDFAEAGNVIKVSLGEDLGEGAITQIGKLSNMFGDSEKMGLKNAMLGIGSAVNQIGQSSAASEPYLVEFLNRMAGIGVQAKLDIPIILGYASVLDQNAQNVEVSSTALNGVISKIFQDPSKFAKIAGLNVKEFAKLLKTDANEAILTLLTTLNSKGGFDQLAPMFADMQLDGVRASQVLSVLANNVDQVRSEQVNAAIAFTEGTSVIKEYNIANNTLTARIQKNKNALWELTVSLGEKLAPAYLQVQNSGIGLGKILLSGTSFLISHSGAIITVVSAIAAYTVAQKTLNTIQAIGNGVMTIAKLNTLAKASAEAIATGNTIRAAAAEKLYSVELAKGSLMSKVYVAATSLLSAAKYLLTGNLKKAKIAMAEFNAVSALNPAALIATGVLALVAAIGYLLVKRAKLYSLETTHKQIEKDISDQYIDQKVKVEGLVKSLNNENLSLDEKRKKLLELKSIVPEYHGQLTAEGKLIDSNTVSIDNYLLKFKQQIRLEATRDKQLALIKKQVDLEDKKREAEKLNENATTNPNLSAGAKAAFYLIAKDKANALEMLKSTIVSMETEIRDMEASLSVSAPVVELIDGQTKVENGITYIAKGGKWIAQVKTEPGGGEDPKVSKQRKTVNDSMTKLEENNLKNLSTIKKSYYDGDLKSDSEYSAALLKQQDDYDTAKKQKLEELLKTTTDTTIKADISKQIAEIDEKAMDRKIDQKKALEKLLLDADPEKAELQAYENKLRDLHLFGVERTTMTEDQLKALELLEQTHIDNMEKIKREGNRPENRLANTQVKKFNEDQAAEEIVLSEKYSKGLMSERQYKNELLVLDLAYLTKKMQINGLTEDQLLELKKQSLEKQKELLESNADLGQGTSPNKPKSKIEDLKSAKQAELDFLNQCFAEDLRNTEAYEIAKKVITDKYALLEQDKKKKDQETMIAAVQFGLESMQMLLSAGSSYAQALTDAETSKINAKYDAEIEAAGNSESAKTAIEKRRDKELNAANKKAENRSFKIQIAQALASTAQSAISAYASTAAILGIGPALAPIAAGVAVAAGMLNVATITKQHQAAMSQYYDGGFTKDGKWDEAQGVVHSNEFVANRFATSNSTLRPLFDMVDYAQRNNTVSSLSKKDLANALQLPTSGYSSGGYTKTSPASSVENNNTSGSYDLLVTVLTLLSKQLESPIKASVHIAGDDGIKKGLDTYDKLINNASR